MNDRISSPDYPTYDPLYDSLYPYLKQLDRLILWYNHQGLTGSKIAKVLIERHEVNIKKITVNKHVADLRQDPTNDVKINSNRFSPSTAKPKTENKWYQIIQKLKEAIPEYIQKMGFKPSSRTMVYQFRDEGIIQESEEGYFNRATVHARLGRVDSTGELIYPKLDLDCFAEDDTRIAVNNYDNHEPQQMMPPSELDYEGFIEDTITATRESINDYDGDARPGFDAERGGRWYGQPEFVEVWEEKNDLIEGFEIILKNRKVNIKANHGFSSLDFLRQCVQELKEVYRCYWNRPQTYSYNLLWRLRPFR